MELLTAQDVSKLFKCSRAHIYGMAAREQIPCVRWQCPTNTGKKKETVRFKKSDVIEFLERNYNGAK